MWSIDTKIKYVKFNLPKELRKETFVHKYNSEKKRMEFYTVYKKHAFIFELNNECLLSTIEQPNGMAVTWFSSPNWLGFSKPNKNFYFFLKGLKLTKQI